MEITSSTIGISVSNLALSRMWYQAVFELDAPDLEPVEGIVEYEVAGIWLQLNEEKLATPASGTVLRFGVANVDAEYIRLYDLGVDVSPIVNVDDAVSYFDMIDPDGNTFSLYTVVS
jgi:predicted enzyme related to lactoylglutathione lyase